MLEIPFGGAAAADPATLEHVTLAPGVPLRLSDGGWRFSEPPGASDLGDRAAQFRFLRDQLKQRCDPWAAHPARFLDGYFALIAAAVARDATRLAARLARFGDLYRVEDFGFAALRPLPRAHLPDATGRIAVDFAFWTGDALIALDVADGRRTRRRLAADHARLAAAGAHTLALAPDALDAARLAAVLPAPLLDFTDGDFLPASPFKTALGDIVDADPRF